MGARKSGSTGINLRAKNSAMAARMKAEGVERTTCRCPLCHKTVSLKQIGVHTLACKGVTKLLPKPVAA